MQDKKQTAVDEMFNIIEGLIDYSPNNPLLKTLIAAKTRLKEIEKKQIIKSFTIGNRQEYYDATENSGEQYYNETYGGNK